MSCHLVKRGGASVTFIAGLSGAVGSWPIGREVGFQIVKPPQSVMRERREDLVDHRIASSFYTSPHLAWCPMGLDPAGEGKTCNMLPSMTLEGY